MACCCRMVPGRSAQPITEELSQLAFWQLKKTERAFFMSEQPQDREDVVDIMREISDSRTSGETR